MAYELKASSCDPLTVYECEGWNIHEVEDETVHSTSRKASEMV